MGYTITTVQLSNITLDPYLRQVVNDTGMELTNKVTLIYPINNEINVARNKKFSWNNYNPAIPVKNLSYKLEVAPLINSNSVPDWSSSFVRVIPELTTKLRQILNESKFYAWRVTALDRNLPEYFIDTFDRLDIGNGYVVETLQGVGSSEILNESLIIEADGTSQVSRQVVHIEETFKNPEILLKNVEFSSLHSSVQPTIYFNTEGDFVNYQVNGYYLFIWEDTIRVGKVVGNDPSDKRIASFTRIVNTPYNIRIKSVSGHIRVTIWLSNTNEPKAQIDYIDPSNIYESGGISLVQVTGSLIGASSEITIGSIEITYAQPVQTVISGVIVNGDTSDLIENETRTFTSTVEGSGNVEQSVTWSASKGTINSSGQYTADAGLGQIIITATSTQDNSVSGTLSFDVIEETVPTVISDVAVTGDTSDLVENTSRSFQADVQGSGNVQQSVTWSASKGTINSSGQYTADGGLGQIIITATSTQDTSVSGTLTFDVIEEVIVDPPAGSQAGDEARLVELYNETQGVNHPSVPTVGDLPSLTASDHATLYRVNNTEQIYWWKWNSSNQSGSWIFGSDIWENRTGWNGTSMNLSNTIHGITTSLIGGELRVTSIDLRSNGLTSTTGLPNRLDEITEMTYFNVHFNALRGPMSTGLFMHQKLEYCYINHTHKGGEKVDPHVDRTTGGGDVHQGKGPGNDVSRHNIFTDIPTQCNMPALLFFQCSYQDFTGGIIPIGIYTNSPLLEYFSVYGCRFDMHQIPTDIGNWIELTYIAISSNNEGHSGSDNWSGGTFLNGDIPNEFLNLTKLVRARLGRQEFTSIPAGMSALPDLEGLTIGNNKLNMPFDPAWGNGDMYQLDTFDCGANNIYGTLPEFGYMPGLSNAQYTMAYNNLSGKIPDSFWEANPRITNVNFDDNKFSGKIKTDDDLTFISNDGWGRLRNFRYANNQLEGNWPKLPFLKPSHLRSWTRTRLQGNKFRAPVGNVGDPDYDPGDWGMVDDGREYDPNASDHGDSGPIVQKTRRQWYEYHTAPWGGSGKGLEFLAGNQNPD